MGEQSSSFDAVAHPVSDFSRGAEAGAEGPAYDTRFASGAEESLIAEIYLQSPELLLADTIRGVPAAVVEYDYAARGPDGAEHLFCRVRADTYAAFEAALTRDQTVADPLLVVKHDDYRLYRLLAAKAPTVVSALADLGVHLLTAQSDGLGWLLEVQLPDREALIDFREFCRQNDITIRVDKLFRPTAGGLSGGANLSEAQRRTLQVALENGYFDVPRGISQAALAAEMGVSSSAVSQRLRRAIRQVLRDCVD
ncbi:MAG: helix-turn-helix domain-containing protein [Haloarculaceae archaeon]